MTPLAMSCGDDVLAGWLHPANGTVGVVIAVGGGQISCGPQRLFLTLAKMLSQAGHPVLRFDRRGIGDSTGNDPGYLESGPDIAAAVAALRTEAKGVTQVVGIGLCDAATALLLDSDMVDSIIAMNPWPFEAGETRSAAAERAHYRRRLLQPAAWRRFFSGRVNPLPALMSVVRRRAAPPTSLALRIERAVAATADRATYILSARDRTAAAFAGGPGRRAQPVIRLDADHAFSGPGETDALSAHILAIVDAIGARSAAGG